MNKRGLSAIITTLLVVLLVLVAVGIVWGVVGNIIREGAEEVSLGKFTLKADITQASVDNSSNNVSVTVERNPGKGELTGIKFVFSDGVNSEVITRTTTLQELGSETFRFHLADLSVDNLLTISIVPIFTSSSGKELLGNVLSVYNVQTGQIQEPEEPEEPEDCTPVTNPCGSAECGTALNGTCGNVNCGLLDGDCPGTETCVSGVCVSGSGLDCADVNVLCVDDTAGSSQEYSTIQAAANAAQAGDIVLVFEGTYDEFVIVNNGGSSGNYINFVASREGNMPVVRGFRFIDVSYIRVVGFEITHVENIVGGAIRGDGTTSYIEILNNYIHHVRGCNSAGQGATISDYGSGTYWTIRGNTMYYMGYIPGVYDGDNNAAISGNWPNPGTSHWTVEYNDISRAMDYLNMMGTYHIIRNNYIHDTNPNYWVNVGGDVNGFHIDAFQSGSDGGQSFHRYSVYERNFISDFVDYYHCHGALEQDNGASLASTGYTAWGDTDIIMRGNVFANMCGSALGGFAIDYVSAYHNTFHQMGQYGGGGGSGHTLLMYTTSSGDTPDYAVVMNNILSEDGYVDPMGFNNYPVPTTVSEYNLGFNSGSDSSYVSTSDPLFSDTSSQDLTLSSTSSPAYNAGSAITTIPSSGSGTSFNVMANTAHRLIDGFGIVAGDTITVGGTTTRITGIVGNTITVEDSLSFGNNEPVYWGTDTAPDIGAYPYKTSYTLTADYSLAGGTVTVTPNEVDLVRFVVVYEDNIPIGIDSSAPYSISGVGGGILDVKVYPLYASKTLSVSATIV